MRNEDLKYWFDHFKSDKSDVHSYHTIYEPHLDKFTTTFNLLEIGVLTGASSRAFIRCYDNINYFGIDVFRRHGLSVISDLFLHKNFKVLVGDSTSSDIQQYAAETWENIEFDVIIDDGSHFHNDMTATFNNFYPLLKIGGTYFIEDVFPNNFDGLVFNDDDEQLISERSWLLRHNDKWNDKLYSDLLNTIKGYNPSTCEHIDLRVQDNRTDSYIIKVTK